MEIRILREVEGLANKIKLEIPYTLAWRDAVRRFEEKKQEVRNSSQA